MANDQNHTTEGDQLCAAYNWLIATWQNGDHRSHPDIATEFVSRVKGCDRGAAFELMLTGKAYV